MSLRRITILATLLAFLPAFLYAEAPKEVTTADPDPQQLAALAETQIKISALASEPEQPKEQAPPQKQKQQQKKRHVAKHAKGRRGTAPRHAAAIKVAGRRLSEAEVRGVLAGDRDFSGSDLSGLNLAGMDLSRSNFTRADLTRANLERADLSETDLELADLSGAKLSRASLEMARLHGTRLDGARLDGALWIDRTVCRSGSLGKCRE